MVVKAIVNQKQFQGRIERNCLKDALAVWLRVIGGRGMLWSVASELMGDSDKHITFFQFCQRLTVNAENVTLRLGSTGNWCLYQSHKICKADA